MSSMNASCTTLESSVAQHLFSSALSHNSWMPIRTITGLYKPSRRIHRCAPGIAKMIPLGSYCFALCRGSTGK